MTTGIKGVLRELLILIAGILIALLINDWKQDYDDRKYMDKIMSALKEDFKENERDLVKYLEEHKALVDTIHLYMKDETVTLGEILAKVNGIRGVDIKHTASQALIQSKIDLLEYEDFSLLTEIGMDRTIMINKMEDLTDLIYERIGLSDWVSKELFLMTIQDLMHIEEECLENHQQFFKSQSK